MHLDQCWSADEEITFGMMRAGRAGKAKIRAGVVGSDGSDGWRRVVFFSNGVIIAWSGSIPL